MYIVDQANQPENNNKDEEKYRIDHPHEGLADFNLPVSLSLDAPCLGDWRLLVFLLSESVSVGLHNDVHEGFEETEDQPTVQHLDVGGVRKIVVHTDNK